MREVRVVTSLTVVLVAYLSATAQTPGGAPTLMAKAQYAFTKGQYQEALNNLAAAHATGALNEDDKKGALWMEVLSLAGAQKIKDVAKAMEKYVALEPVGTPEPWLWDQTPPSTKAMLEDKQKDWQKCCGAELGEPFVVGAALHVPLERNAERVARLKVSVKGTSAPTLLEFPVSGQEAVGVLSAELWQQTEKTGKFEISVEAYAANGTLLSRTGSPVAVRVVPGLRRMALEELKSGRASPAAAAVTVKPGEPAKGGAAVAGKTTVGNYTATEGTVTDPKTGLTWQRKLVKDGHTWAQAKAYCSSLALEGPGWRLPSLKDVKTLVDRNFEPAIDPNAFPDTPPTNFWTSTPSKDRADVAWALDFELGSSSDEKVNQTFLVRCVRGGQP
jgi:hypothetical protein